MEKDNPELLKGQCLFILLFASVFVKYFVVPCGKMSNDSRGLSGLLN